MPLSSTEIAAMNGAYMQQSMGQLQYSNAIGQSGQQYGAQSSGLQGDQMMGSMMNRASSVGAPMMAGAMGMLGLDPMSLGLRAGMGAYGAGAGLGGAAMVGAGVGMPLMAAGAAAKYAGQQMYTGAHQQNELNNTLRSSFNFQNQQGGTGFGRSDMTSIGSMVRQMSDQFGPGGEITGFKELTQLTGKMGSMGFAQGVRDVQEFSKKFKEMVTTLKGMAKDLGTTLEGAMEFAAAAKGSGVFGMNNVGKFTSQVRSASVSGGLAISEVTGAANIGSQISRSIGGLGRQGAGAGIRTINQIGSMGQMGMLSEEDIYNVTGQTGAEGRQAYAASAMSSSARFLQSGKGRRFLASVAGKHGELDETGIQQLLSGGMSIDETIKRDNGMKANVGRADFIRNEGRLRGAAMERLGGFIPAMQLQQWASSKGIDIQNMDDRSMLFAQRQLGMGRDEVDQAVKMATNMPAILEQEKRSQRQDGYFQNIVSARKGQGVEGVQQRFNQAKEQVNNKLQKVGQDVFNSGSDQIDQFINKLMGTYVETYSKDIDDKFRGMMGGGAGGAAGRRAFGIGDGRINSMRKGSGTIGGLHDTLGLSQAMNMGSRGGLEASLGADTELNARNVAALGLGGVFGLATGQTGQYFMHGESGVGKLRDAGYKVGGDSAHMRAQLDAIERQGKMPAGAMDAVLGRTRGHLSESAGNLAYADAVSGSGGQGSAGETMLGSGLNAVAGSLLGPLGGLAASLGGVGGSIAESITGSRSGREDAGKFIQSAAGKDLTLRLLSTDGGVAESARAALEKEIGANGAAGPKKDMLEAADYNKFLTENPGASNADQEKWAKARGVDLGTTRKKLEGLYGAGTEMQNRDRGELSRRLRTEGHDEMNAGIASGVYDTTGNLAAGKRGEIRGIAGKAGEHYAAYGARRNQLEGKLGGTKETEAADLAILTQMEHEARDQKAELAGMTTKQQRNLASSLTGTQEGSEAMASATFRERFDKKVRRGKGATGAAAEMLGISMTAEESKKLDLGSEAGAAAFLKKSGITDAALIKQLREGVAGDGGTKGGVHTADALRSITESEQFKDNKKKQSMEEAEGRDPLQAAIKKNGEDANKYLQALVKSNTAAAAELTKLNDKSAGDPEGTGKGGVKPI